MNDLTKRINNFVSKCLLKEATTVSPKPSSPKKITLKEPKWRTHGSYWYGR